MSDYPQHQPQVPSINQVPNYPQQGYPQQPGPPNQGPPPMQPGWNGQPIQQQAVQESWILTPHEMHLGFIKESFQRGSVITHDVTNNRLIVNGRVFYDTRDLDLLKSQSRRTPHNPWVLPYDEDTLMEIKGIGPVEPQTAPNVHNPRDHSMPIVQEDAYGRPDIDIRHTKVAANNVAAQVAARDARQGQPMEIIRGDETVQDRIARLGNKGDIASIAERERLKRERWTPEIVHDDSLGMVGGSKATSLNAGQPMPTRASAAQNAERASAEANARKQAADTRRGYGVPQQPQQMQNNIPPTHPTQADVDPALYDEVAAGYPEAPQAPQQAPAPVPAHVQPPATARMDQLEGQVGEIAGQMGEMFAMMQQMAGQAPAPAAPAPVAPAPAPAEVERVPVTDAATVAAVEASAGPVG